MEADDLKEVMNQRFNEVLTKIGEMVSQGEFDAQVQRLDGRSDHNDNRLTALENRLNIEVQESKDALDSAVRERKDNFDRITKQIENSNRETNEKFERSSVTTRWWFMAIVSIMSLFLTFFSPILRQAFFG